MLRQQTAARRSGGASILVRNATTTTGTGQGAGLSGGGDGGSRSAPLMPRTPRAPTPPSPPCPQKVDRATRLEDDPAAAVPTAPPTMRDVLGGLLNAIDAGAEEATRKLTRGALDEGSGGGQSYGMGRGG
eukprot:70853-Chlamydomonas_euryale.AAC.1